MEDIDTFRLQTLNVYKSNGVVQLVVYTAYNLLLLGS